MIRAATGSCRLTTSLFRSTWSFTHARGSMTVEVHSRMQSSDSRMVRNAARMGMGMGITILPRILVDEDLGAGTLVPLLEDFPVTVYWVKMLVPRMKINRPAVHALVNFLKEGMAVLPPNSAELHLGLHPVPATGGP